MHNLKFTTRWALIAGVGIAFSAAGLVGCAEDEPDTTTVVSTPAPAPAPTTTVTTGGSGSPQQGTTPQGTPPFNENTNAGAGGATGTQTALADEISKKIIRNPQMTGSRVAVVVDSANVATLTGFTQNQQQKALAEKSARDTSGISSVENKLEIRPTGGAKRPKPAAAPAPATKTQVIVVPVPQREKAPPAPKPSTKPAPAEKERVLLGNGKPGTETESGTTGGKVGEGEEETTPPPPPPPPDGDQ